MTFPKVRTSVSDVKPARSAPTDTTTVFVAMEATRGPLEALGPFHSIRDTRRPLGDRAGLTIAAWDVVDVLLREGVTSVYFARVIGAGYATASLALPGPGGTVATVQASSPGTWANGAAGGLSIEVVNGPNGAGERQLIARLGGVEVERSPVFTTRAAMLTWGDPLTSKATYLRVIADAVDALPTVAGAANLAGGLDGAATVSADVRAALDRFGRGLGPGQVLAPFRTTSATHTEVLEHCQDRNRDAFLDAAQGVSVASQLALVTAQRAFGSGATGLPRLGGIWGQYATGPGVAPGTTRTLPWSVVQAGLTARAERAEGHPNVSPTGPQGVPTWAEGVDRYYDESDGGDAETLFDGGVNVVVQRYGAPRAYTFRTLEDDTLSDWHELAHTRVASKIVALADQVGEGLQGYTVTADGKAQGLFGARLGTALGDLYGKGALFGETQGEAFSVDTGPTQNTLETIAARELHAGVGFKASPHAEQLYIDVAKVPTAQEV